MFRPATSTEEITGRLVELGVNPTAQRIEVARLFLSRCTHLSADEVYQLVNRHQAQVSKATVYNTLGLFAEKGLIRELVVDPTKVFYDSNVEPHHHLYNVTNGELLDIDVNHMHVIGVPPLPEGTRVEGMDVIVRVRSTEP